MFKLIPTDEKFFELFQKSADLLLEGAKVLQAMAADPSTIAANAAALERLEHDGDRLTHEILIRLDRSFITPIDREDIHQLALVLDDCMDFMESVTERMVLYKLDTIPQAVKELTRVIFEQVKEIQAMMPKVKKLRFELVNPHCVEINRLENEADKIERGALAELFNGSMDPLNVMKWRDVYDFLETTTDKCEDVAGIVEGIVLKHG